MPSSPSPPIASAAWGRVAEPALFGTPPGTVSAAGCVVDGVLIGGAGDASILVIVADGDGFRAAALAMSELETTPLLGIDPALGLTAVRTARPLATEAGTPADWPAAVAAAQVALAHQLIGASHAMLQLAREHAVGRVQFDRPISGFQAVRHRLADALVAIASAEAAVAAA